MTPRSIRRAAERKAAKLARKAARLGGPDARVLSSGADDRLSSSAAITARAQINRANSLHSNGPRTEIGNDEAAVLSEPKIQAKASSRNSLKHGLASGQLIVPGEDPAAFQSLLDDLLDEYRPANPTEELLVNEMAQSYWLEQRAIRLQNGCFTESGVDGKRLSLFLRYQTTHQRAFHKALNTLLKLKQSRAREQAAARRGFVSQNQPASRSARGVVSHGGGEAGGLDEPAILSEAKTQAFDEPAILSEAKTQAFDEPAILSEAKTQAKASQNDHSESTRKHAA